MSYRHTHLWDDADPGIAEVDGARERVAEINKDCAIYLGLRIIERTI